MTALQPIAQTGPRTSVVLATCDRRGPAATAIRSILANRGDFELVIVDQSEDDAAPPSFRPSRAVPLSCITAWRAAACRRLATPASAGAGAASSP